MFSDPVNFIDPNGKIFINLISAAVGAYLGYDSVANNPCASTSSKIEGALIGALSNAFNGGVAFNLLVGVVGNLGSQLNEPSFKGDINWSQVAVAGVLSEYNVGAAASSRLPKKVTVVGNAIVSQSLNSLIINKS